MSAAYPPAPTPPRHLPIGVGILAILIGIVGVLLVIAGILLMLAFGFIPGLAVFGLAGILGGAVLLVIGIILLAVASGLWHLRLWALIPSILVVALLLLSDALNGNLLSLGGIILIILLIYLIAVHREFI